MLELLRYFKSLDPKPSMYHHKCHDNSLSDCVFHIVININFSVKKTN